MDDLLFALFKLLDDWSPFFQPKPDDISHIIDQSNDHTVDVQRYRRETEENSRPVHATTRRVPAKR